MKHSRRLGALALVALLGAGCSPFPDLEQGHSTRADVMLHYGMPTLEFDDGSVLVYLYTINLLWDINCTMLPRWFYAPPEVDGAPRLRLQPVHAGLPQAVFEFDAHGTWMKPRP